MTRLCGSAHKVSNRPKVAGPSVYLSDRWRRSANQARMS